MCESDIKRGKETSVEKRKRHQHRWSRKRDRVFVCEPEASSFFWQTLNTNRLSQCHKFNQVSQVQNNRRDSDDVPPQPGSHEHAEAVHFRALVSPSPGDQTLTLDRCDVLNPERECKPEKLISYVCRSSIVNVVFQQQTYR